MRNFIQAGNTIPVAAPANVKSGDPVVVGSIFGIAAFDADSGDSVEIATEGVFDLPKPNSVVTFAQGAPVFFDNSAKTCKTTATGYFKIGIATVAAGATESVVRCRLDDVSLTAVPGA